MSSVKHLYLIGIGGVGMAWIADYALNQGWSVSGSDIVPSALTRRLEQAGADIHYGSDPARIAESVTEAVVNSAITPTSPSYPEFEAILARKIPLQKRAQWVGELTRQKKTVAVAGTHGKTTTTAMIGWILVEAGMDPTVFTGGSIAAWGSVTKIGYGPHLILEADEYDRSFHHFKAEIVVLLNLDADHTDYYTKGLPEIEHSFRRFLRNLPHRKGLVVAYGKDGSLRKILKGFKYRMRWYDEQHLWPGLTLQLPGTHNKLNATAAARVAHELGVPQAKIIQALATFPGVGRRFEEVGVWNQATVFDDYAHHPSEIKATLQALRERFPKKYTTVIFQPHQKARTRDLLVDFGRAFDENPPDVLILAPIYQVAGREGDIEISSADIATQIARKNIAMQVVVALTEEELEAYVREISVKEGIMMSMGAGSIRSLLDRWRS